MMSQSSSLKQFNCSIVQFEAIQLFSLKEKHIFIHRGDSKHNKSHQIKMGIVTCAKQCDGKKLVILIC